MVLYIQSSKRNCIVFPPLRQQWPLVPRLLWMLSCVTRWCGGCRGSGSPKCSGAFRNLEPLGSKDITEVNATPTYTHTLTVSREANPSMKTSLAGKCKSLKTSPPKKRLIFVTIFFEKNFAGRIYCKSIRLIQIHIATSLGSLQIQSFRRVSLQ